MRRERGDMTAITITISSPSRAIVAEGRLVAGETAEVSIEGVAPSALYLVAPDQTVVAACEAFTPKGQGTGGVGFLQLATEQIAALFANTPAGRMIAVWALINGADGVAGAGWVPVLSAPMPDELVDLDIDFYLRASQVGAGLAIVDGKLVCTVNPATYLTKAEAAQTYATQTALAGKQDTISDLATIRAGAAAGSTAVQSVNGVTPTAGAVTITGADIETASGSGNSVLDAIANITQDIETIRAALPYALGETITASAQLADRTGNRVMPLADNTAPIVLTFPAENVGFMRDFLVLVTNTTGNTGSISFTPPTGATVYGDGFTHSPASGETWLYSITEEAANVFWCKSEKMEVAQ